MSDDWSFPDGTWRPAPGALHENEVITGPPPRGSHLADARTIPTVEHGTHRDDPDYDREGTPGTRAVFVTTVPNGPRS